MISGIPLHAHFEDIEPLLKPYGKVEDCCVVPSKDPNTQTIHITFENYDQAHRYTNQIPPTSSTKTINLVILPEGISSC